MKIEVTSAYSTSIDRIQDEFTLYLNSKCVGNKIEFGTALDNDNSGTWDVTNAATKNIAFTVSSTESAEKFLPIYSTLKTTTDCPISAKLYVQ